MCVYINLRLNVNLAHNKIAYLHMMYMLYIYIYIYILFKFIVITVHTWKVDNYYKFRIQFIYINNAYMYSCNYIFNINIKFYE